MIDCISNTPVVASVVIEQNHIVGIGTSHAGPGDEVMDLRGGFLMPGLWDAHAHLGIALGDPNKRPPFESPASRTMRAAKNAIDGLKVGITSIRVVGERDHVDVALRNAFDSGIWDGPGCGCVRGVWPLLGAMGYMLVCRLSLTGRPLSGEWPDCNSAPGQTNLS